MHQVAHLDGGEGAVIALVAGLGAGPLDGLHQQLMRFGGRTEEEARETLTRMQTFGEGHLDRVLLRRDLPRSAALWIAAAMRKDYGLRIVADDGFSDEHLLDAPEALALPEAHKPEGSKSGIGFWGVVGAVVLGLLIASLL